MNNTMNESPRTEITGFDLGQLATSLADNVTDSGPAAFDSPEQAVRLHEDDISELAVEYHGRRLTRDEWFRVAALAAPMVEYQFATWRRAREAV